MMTRLDYKVDKIKVLDNARWYKQNWESVILWGGEMGLSLRNIQTMNICVLAVFMIWNDNRSDESAYII